MTFDEILKTSLVFAHFFASAVALAAILRADFFILTRYGSALTAKSCARIHGVKRVVGPALLVLWLTGLAICFHGYLHAPAYLTNQKLWMKVMVVLTLTLNGWFLHRHAFRHIRPGVCLAELAPRTRRGLIAMGSLSSGSWLFACFLGIARALNNKPNLVDLAGVYLLMLGLVFAGGVLVTHMLDTWGRRGFPVSSRWAGRLLGTIRPGVDRGQESELQI
ncbi:MAG: hypothetical protein QM742_03545 [Aquabacterium sp.]